MPTPRTTQQPDLCSVSPPVSRRGFVSIRLNPHPAHLSRSSALLAHRHDATPRAVLISASSIDQCRYIYSRPSDQTRSVYVKEGRTPGATRVRTMRDRVTARYLWDIAREIIEARCAAISWRTRIVQQILEIRREESGSARSGTMSTSSPRVGSLRTGFVSFGD